MKCPRCETTALEEKDREGVVVDICSQCRGLWLDRGELEKLIARAARDIEEIEQQHRPSEQQHRPSARPQERDYPPPAPDPRYANSAPDPRYANSERYAPPRPRRDSDPDYRYHQGYNKHHRKKSFIESLGDIFD